MRIYDTPHTNWAAFFCTRSRVFMQLVAFYTQQINVIFVLAFLFKGKPDRKFVVVVTLAKRTFVDEYNDINSPSSRALIVELTVIFVPYFKRTFPLFVRIIFIRFFPGSVGVEFDMLLEPTSNTTNRTIVQELQNANRSAELQFETLGKITAREVLPDIGTTPSATPTPTGTLLCFVS